MDLIHPPLRPSPYLPGIKALLSAAGQRPTAPSGGRYCNLTA